MEVDWGVKLVPESMRTGHFDQPWLPTAEHFGRQELPLQAAAPEAAQSFDNLINCLSKASSSMPEVSIIMPAGNAEATIGQSIESVQGQTFQNWSLLIADTGSAGQTAAIARSYAAADSRIRLVPGARLGPHPLSTYVSLIGPDDIWSPEKLDTQLGQIRDSDADGVLCNAGASGNGAQALRFSGAPGLMALLGGVRIDASTVLLRRDAYDKGGGFIPARPALSFLLKLLHSEGTVVGFPEVMVRRPEHAGAATGYIVADIAALSAVAFPPGPAEDARRRRVLGLYHELFDQLAATGSKKAIRSHIPALNAALGNPRIGSALNNLLFLPAGLFRSFSSWLFRSLMK